jgi:hypothetical protein
LSCEARRSQEHRRVGAGADRFILKGAALLLLWLGEPIRPTKDVDLLGLGDTSADALKRVFVELCAIESPDDGLTFLPDRVSVDAIREDQEYGGMRVKLMAMLGNVRIPLQVDVGAGDAVVPAPEVLDYPGLLDLPRARIRAYRPETSIAEKTEAMVRLALANSRMKDFFDIHRLASARLLVSLCGLGLVGPAWPGAGPSANMMSVQDGTKNMRQPLIRLTAEHLRKLLLVDLVILRLQQDHPGASVGNPGARTTDFETAGVELERRPEILQVLRQSDWTGRDYLLTLAVTVSAVFGELPDFAQYGPEWDANVTLLSNPPAGLAAEFAEWKRIRLGVPPRPPESPLPQP